MQRPDASASAPRAAGFESISLFSLGDLPQGLDLPCAGDPELFFAEAPEDVEAAKALCQECRFRITCLQGALQRREPWGVWGGELLLRGTVVPRKRPRGRPRKESATEIAGAASAGTASIGTASIGAASADERAA